MKMSDSNEFIDNSIGSKLNQVLNKLMKDNRVTLGVLHKNTGVPLPTIKRLQTDPNANPTVSTLLPIAQFFQITINQLIGAKPLNEKLQGFRINESLWQKIPMLAWENISKINQENINDFAVEYVSTDIEIGEQAYALRVKDNKWLGFMPGSILIIDPELEASHKDYVVVQQAGIAHATLRQVLIDKENVFLKPLNVDFQPYLLNENNQILGVLLQIKNDFKS